MKLVDIVSSGEAKMQGISAYVKAPTCLKYTTAEFHLHTHCTGFLSKLDEKNS